MILKGKPRWLTVWRRLPRAVQSVRLPSHQGHGKIGESTGLAGKSQNKNHGSPISPVGSAFAWGDTAVGSEVKEALEALRRTSRTAWTWNWYRAPGSRPETSGELGGNQMAASQVSVVGGGLKSSALTWVPNPSQKGKRQRVGGLKRSGLLPPLFDKLIRIGLDWW